MLDRALENKKKEKGIQILKIFQKVKESLEREKHKKQVPCDLIRSGDPCAPAHSDNAQKAKSLIIKKKIK
ncbi:MAG: hypothetical protein KBD36_04570 [Alphaproteobacteria bacterium]|jgi:hypothetical protein|nr:hypothetical protein [Alphaproteobacteria bacterium]MBP9777099.1 hypothetical protein [Alphaproteobacteria bacterium]